MHRQGNSETHHEQATVKLKYEKKTFQTLQKIHPSIQKNWEKSMTFLVLFLYNPKTQGNITIILVWFSIKTNKNRNQLWGRCEKVMFYSLRGPETVKVKVMPVAQEVSTSPEMCKNSNTTFRLHHYKYVTLG